MIWWTSGYEGSAKSQMRHRIGIIGGSGLLPDRIPDQMEGPACRDKSPAASGSGTIRDCPARLTIAGMAATGSLWGWVYYARVR